MDRAKALEKIQKCLALGKSPNEHEAAAAMRQAQALMRNFEVSERELDIMGFNSETVQTAIQAGKKIPITLANIVTLMRRAFGVTVVYERVKLRTDYNFAVSYIGREDRVMLAGYAHTVVARAVEQSWQKHLKERPWLKGQVGSRAGFYAGWVMGVQEKIEAFAMSDEDKKGAELFIEHHYGALEDAVRSKTKIDSHTARAGLAASKEFSLHRPVNGAAAPEILKIGN